MAELDDGSAVVAPPAGDPADALDVEGASTLWAVSGVPVLDDDARLGGASPMAGVASNGYDVAHAVLASSVMRPVAGATMTMDLQDGQSPEP